MTVESFSKLQNPFLTPTANSSHIWPLKVQQNHIKQSFCFLFIFLTRYETEKKKQTIAIYIISVHDDESMYPLAILFCLPAHVMSWQKKYCSRYEVNEEQDKSLFLLLP
jgi:hypothetical protein